MINLESNIDIDKDFEEGFTAPSPIKRIISELNRNMMPDGRFDKLLGNPKKEIIKEKHKILIVDDDQINIMVLSKYMQFFTDCEFETAFHGKQAVDIIKQRAEIGFFFDVILMDCNMPVMDGFQASDIIKIMEKNMEIPYTPIVAITANVGTAAKDKCLNHGMEYYITKPSKNSCYYRR